jgi:hypothetical protein
MSHIVLKNKVAQQLSQSNPEESPVLVTGDKVTVFTSYDRARNAIRRTVRRAEQKPKNTLTEKSFKIVPTEAEWGV